MSASHGVDGVEEDEVAWRHQHEEDPGGAGVQRCTEDPRDQGQKSIGTQPFIFYIEGI